MMRGCGIMDKKLGYLQDAKYTIKRVNQIIMSKTAYMGDIQLPFKNIDINLSGNDTKSWYILFNMLSCVFPEDHIKAKVYADGLNYLNDKSADTSNPEVVFKAGLKKGMERLNEAIEKTEKDSEN